MSTEHGWTGRHRLASILTSRRPEGFQLEVRHHDDLNLTEYRYKRLSDGVWCQQAVSDLLAEDAISLGAVADHVIAKVLGKFREWSPEARE